jgi:hypothetical protein
VAYHRLAYYMASLCDVLKFPRLIAVRWFNPPLAKLNFAFGEGFQCCLTFVLLCLGWGISNISQDADEINVFFTWAGRI